VVEFDTYSLLTHTTERVALAPSPIPSNSLPRSSAYRIKCSDYVQLLHFLLCVSCSFNLFPLLHPPHFHAPGGGKTQIGRLAAALESDPSHTWGASFTIVKSPLLDYCNHMHDVSIHKGFVLLSKSKSCLTSNRLTLLAEALAELAVHIVSISADTRRTYERHV
jgi:hypothetical protein